VGKDKLRRWAELATFENVIQPQEVGFGIDHIVKGQWNSMVLKNSNPIVLELGCGKGEYTVGLAQRYPDINFIGIDIKGARMWRGAKTANETGLKNTAFLRIRIEFIESFFAEDEVSGIWITFPDPHIGKNNPNRRLTCPMFLNRYRGFLKDGGVVRLKTDNRELYEYTKEIVDYNGLEVLSATTDLYKDFADSEILEIKTHYEKIFSQQGLPINYLEFKLKKEREILLPNEGS
jgi:tRNA (guanine-N7-)-methyltransferase